MRAKDWRDSAPTPSPVTRLLDSAATLFAQYGYAAVTTRAIVNAATINLGLVHYYFGSKRALYLELLRQMYDEERTMAQRLMANMERPPATDRAALREFFNRLTDELVDIELRHPARARLHMWRWLAQDDDLADTEGTLVGPSYELVHHLLLEAQRVGTLRQTVDLAAFIRSYAWLIYGYFIIGPVDWQTWSTEPRDPNQVATFKRYLRDYSTRMLGLDVAEQDEP
jgi:AcrR family transcriptional regulator